MICSGHTARKVAWHNSKIKIDLNTHTPIEHRWQDEEWITSDSSGVAETEWIPTGLFYFSRPTGSLYFLAASAVNWGHVTNSR